MKTLIINAHPNFNNKDSFSYKLQEMFLKKYKDTFPNDTPEILNLYAIDLPRIDTTQLLNIWEKQHADETMTEDECYMSEITTNLLLQFKSYHRIIIVSPLHNFNVTSRLKDYIDNILVARQTFKYTSEGSVGLMTDNYKALYLQASGSIYTNDDRYKPLDFSYSYLRAMFEDIMAFDAFYIARAQGTAILTEETILQNAEYDLDQAFNAFYNL
ncbi:FMN-dependent NADH-azoreductase [Staphylococcus equorum]|uniref:FMN-dependent NADH-azoreductase n=1 Tax=Staphylococcus equorum TaxID=246432 RepID=UPI000806412D|nr:NAD(P)H-dependent oxidoreductase [Staphylococcus equorum]ANQ63434.1 FMN-dependent NADH-azoreductase [Staphylococcus equorum]